MSEQVSIIGIPFFNTTMENMVSILEDHVKKEEKAFVVTANPEIVMAALEDQNYMEAIEQANYITADGIGIVKAAELLGTPLPERVAGFDLFLSLLQKANDHQYKIYLLGAKKEVLQRTIATIEKEYPQVQVVGSHHGFFDWEDTSIEEEIHRLSPDFVFVALGFPRQERWISERIATFQKGVFIGIGGSFDVLADEVKRAPMIWQKLHLEWFYRLIQQPSRWKRTLALPRFVLKVFGERLRKKA